MADHKFALGQTMCTDNELFKGKVEVKALLPDRCHEHNLPRYGCSAGDSHFAFCEEVLAPLTPSQKRRLN